MRLTTLGRTSIIIALIAIGALATTFIVNKVAKEAAPIVKPIIEPPLNLAQESVSPIKTHEPQPVVKKKRTAPKGAPQSWINDRIFRVEIGPDGDPYLVDDGGLYLHWRKVFDFASDTSVGRQDPYLYGYFNAAKIMIQREQVGVVDVNLWLDHADSTSGIDTLGANKVLGITDIIFVYNTDTVTTEYFDRFLRAANFDDPEQRSNIKAQCVGIAVRWMMDGKPDTGIERADRFLQSVTGSIGLGDYTRFFVITKNAER